ncbi:hypothetical protein CTEN210_05529 [Chaetoceros tenuissimus]|uniref:Uncharacterized protein n=1 Tax=Chaetoceros tenuissimus TaxID=426638 RepID=A0AAD3H3U9_9STRA|nr:hypothetical protein CTEN210_05529 [Chaetoceros tenuissimus]
MRTQVHPDVLNLVANSSVVEQNVVTESTREHYTRRLVELVKWLYKEKQEVLSQETITTMAAKMQEDRQNRSKSLTKTTQYLKKRIDKLRRHDPSSSPILIDRFTYDIVSEFFVTKSNIETVDVSLALKFYRKLQSYDRDEDDDGHDTEDEIRIEPDENGQVKIAVRQEPSTYEGFRSAIAHLYREIDVPMPVEMALNLKRYIAGSQRINDAAKQCLGLKVKSGKDHMTIEVYEKIAKLFFYSGKTEHVFAHAFHVLDWNLMKRAENVAHCKIAHIFFCNDSLVFIFAKSKSTKKEEKFLGPWHVYANPHKPWLCPVLALARYLLTYPEAFAGSRPLFEGNNSYSRYDKEFNTLLKKNKEEIESLGIKIKDLGTHSARKGVGTCLASGCTVSPPIVSICLRMGWALGGVLGRYFKHADAGDEFCGRMASLVEKALEKEFAVSCPYFDFTELENEDEKEKMKKELQDFIDARLPTNTSPAARRVARCLFASVCYHHNTLKDTLHESCPFRQSRFFIDMPPKIQELSRVAYPWNSTADTPKLTGIPPYIVQLAEFAQVRNELVALRESLQPIVAGELDERGVGCTEFYTKRMHERLDVLEDRLIENNREMVQEIKGTVEDRLEEIENTENFDIFEENKDSTTENAQVSQRKRRKITAGMVNGVVTVLPSDFEFPKGITATHLIQNWFLGNRMEGIVPYRRLSAKILINEAQKKLFRRMKQFMNCIKFYAEAEKCWIEGNNISVAAVVKIWQRVGWKWIYQKYAEKSDKKFSRFETLSWQTIVDKMNRRGAFRQKQNDCKNDGEWLRSIYSGLALNAIGEGEENNTENV